MKKIKIGQGWEEILRLAEIKKGYQDMWNTNDLIDFISDLLAKQRREIVERLKKTDSDDASYLGMRVSAELAKRSFPKNRIEIENIVTVELDKLLELEESKE